MNHSQLIAVHMHMLGWMFSHSSLDGLGAVAGLVVSVFAFVIVIVYSCLVNMKPSI